MRVTAFSRRAACFASASSAAMPRRADWPRRRACSFEAASSCSAALLSSSCLAAFRPDNSSRTCCPRCAACSFVAAAASSRSNWVGPGLRWERAREGLGLGLGQGGAYCLGFA
eukprot:scaffold5341_cov60-Phaeocystis_antarctica.AAC.4